MITFKQFLSEEDREIYAKKLGDVPDWAPNLAEKSYRIGKVTFSAKDGLGSVPFNQSVYYHGFVAMVTPDRFLKLALPHMGERDDTASKIVKLVGEGYAVGIPFLQINMEPVENGTGPAQVSGHEGRARMLAVKHLNGNQLVPIHCFLTGGLRSRDMTPELIDAVKGRLQCERSKQVITDPFDGIYINVQSA